jgi:uncharacterized membrane protein
MAGASGKKSMAMLLFFCEHSRTQGAIQEMEINWNQISEKLALACLFLLVFGFGFNLVVERFQNRTQRYTAELVVIGVLVTIGISGFFIGWDDVLIVLILFIFSGGPMIAGSWMRTAKDEEAAKKVAQDSLKELKQ